MVWKIALIALVGALAAFGLTGCCPWLGEQAAEEAIEQTTGVKVDEDGESVTIETEDGSAQIQGGENAEIPDDFPSSLPVYDGTVMMSSAIETPEGKVFTVGIETGDSLGDVGDWYKDELESEGWTILSEVTNDSGDGSMMSYAVEGPDGQAQIIIGEEDGKTVISMSVTSETM